MEILEILIIIFSIIFIAGVFLLLLVVALGIMLSYIGESTVADNIGDYSIKLLLNIMAYAAVIAIAALGVRTLYGLWDNLISNF